MAYYLSLMVLVFTVMWHKFSFIKELNISFTLIWKAVVYVLLIFKLITRGVINRRSLCSGRIHYKISLKVCLQDGQVLSSI